MDAGQRHLLQDFETDLKLPNYYKENINNRKKTSKGERYLFATVY